MRHLAALALLLATVAAGADRRAPRVNLDVVVPVPPYEHERLHFFAPGDRHVVPGTVTINGAPYACDVHGLEFRDRERFLAHLSTAHDVAPDRVADHIAVRDGRVHFLRD